MAFPTAVPWPPRRRKKFPRRCGRIFPELFLKQINNIIFSPLLSAAAPRGYLFSNQMNNLVFASLVAAAALGVLLRQQGQIETIAAETQHFSDRAEKARALARASSDEERRLESLYTTESVAVQALRTASAGGT